MNPSLTHRGSLRSHSPAARGLSGAAPFKEVPRAFGIDNAKQLPLEDTVKFFVPQPQFKTLFVAKNHILLGSRGSGKTTWVRMMAHDHVMLAAKDASPRADYARSALADNLIGIYVPASTAFTGDLHNKPWQSEREAEEYFVWRLNLQSCAAITYIIDSCIEQYGIDDQLAVQVQTDICRALSSAWTNDTERYTTYDGLRLALSRLEVNHQAAIRRGRMGDGQVDAPNDHFHNDLFLPLRHAIKVIRAYLALPERAVWMLCLDEVEYLTLAQQRILNTQLRSASGDLVFKITTMPFAHHTLATNMEDPVREGHDFEYVYVDQEPIDSRGNQGEGGFLAFAREVFALRMGSRSGGLGALSLKSLLGPSPLLDDRRVESQSEIEQFMVLLRKHANPQTIARAERLRGTHKFKSEIVRKLQGALLLRDAVLGAHGNEKLRVYCGETLVVRCCDGNPRRLMRVINLLVQRLEVARADQPSIPIDSGIQNEVLETLARDTLMRTGSEPPNGELTSRYLNAIGSYMRWTFKSSPRRLGTDQVTSVSIVEEDGLEAQRFIKQAIQLSLMIPAKSVPIKTPDHTCIGDFHLSFLFAPLFQLLPRRNRAVRLSRVLGHAAESSQDEVDLQASLLDQS